MKKFAVSFFVVTLLFLQACSSDSDLSVNAPKIKQVYTDISHNHPSFFEKWGATTTVRPLRFSVSVDIDDRQGVYDTEEVFIHHKEMDKHWYLLGGPESISWTNCYSQYTGMFECLFYDADNPDTLPLTGWEVSVEDSQGNITTKDFEFLLPGGGSPNLDTFAYSSAYSGEIENGVAALEVLSQQENQIVFTQDYGDEENVRIEFVVTDARVSNYKLFFYDDSDEVSIVGRVCSCADSIQSTPVSVNEKVVLNLPLSEIEFEDGYTLDDISGLHVELIDEPVEWHSSQGQESIWSNYLSFSEFVQFDRLAAAN